jgi:hypothetical protein
MGIMKLGRYVRELMKRRKSWKGDMHELLAIVGAAAGFKAANKLSNALRRLTPLLASVGITVIFARNAAHRTFTIERQ